VRAVILPATLLLVPGLVPGLRPDPLAAVRDAVRAALGELTSELTSDGRLPLVLAHGPVLRHGRMRPSLAGSGVDDRWLPAPATGPGPRPGPGPDATAPAPWPDGDLPPAGTGASVALLALADVLGPRAADVETLEVPPDGVPGGALGGTASAALTHAAGLVVAGGGAPGGLDSAPDALTGGIRAALRLVGADAWDQRVQVFEQTHDHLPPAYRVTTLA
jgi:hypothetical protein